MRWFGAAFSGLKHVSNSSVPQIFKVVALLLSFPCFKISHFFFKLAYAINQRRALLIRRKCAVLGIDNRGLEFDHLGIEGLSVAQTYHRLRDIASELDRRKCRANAR